MMHPHPDQYVLDFSSRANERCAALLGLRAARLPIVITRGRLEGVIELLQRLVLLAKCLPESLSETISVDAQVMAIAARVERRRSVSEKTVRNWKSDAKMLGLLTVDYASQQYGGCRWNGYTLHFDRVVALTAGTRTRGAETGGNGRKRPEMFSDPGAVKLSDPGAETFSDPNSVFPSVIHKDHSPPLPRPSSETQAQALCSPGQLRAVVVSDLDRVPIEEIPQSSERAGQTAVPDELGLLRELESLGMCDARGAVVRAKARGLTHAQISELIERYRADSAVNNQMTVGWLYRWLAGQSRPSDQPMALAALPPRPRKTPEQLAAEREEYQLRRQQAIEAAANDLPLGEQLRRARQRGV